MGTGLPPFGAGWFGVRARHGDRQGEYALLMPMTTEQATIGGRETFGEPKKIADSSLDVNGDRLSARIARMGSTIAEVTGTLGAEQAGYEIDKLDFYFKLLPDPSGDGLEGDPALVYCRRHETARMVRPVGGGVQVPRSPPRPGRRSPGEGDPLVRVRRARFLVSAGRSSTACRQSGWCRSCISGTTT